MKKYYITSNAASKHGYDFIVNDNGDEKRIELTKKTTDGYLHIPAEYHDELNMRLIRIAILEGQEGLIEIQRREGRGHSVKSDSSKVTKGIEAYLNEEELKMWNELKTKAEARMKIAQAKAFAEAAQREYERLLAEAQA
jgi:ribonuclease HI